MAKGDGEEVWFDGVNKKLIEIHSKKHDLVAGSSSNLTTKTPLSAYSEYLKAKQSSHQNPPRCNEEPSAKAKVARLINSKLSDGTVRPNTGVTDELAMDCEMVECFHHKSVLARVSIVNLFGHPILDRFVAPPSKVTDYRTRYSGIRRRDLIGAPEFEEVQQEVAQLIKGRIVVGHAIHNDFGVLKISHPPDKIRDTAEYFKYLFGGKSPSLKRLCETVLGVKIQSGEHDSVQDAQATMKLYVKERDKWNARILKRAGSADHKQEKQKKKSKKMKTFYVLTH